MVDSNLLLYLITGAFAGIASGLLGVGGGLIIVPVLFFVFSAQGLPAHHIMHLALATSLATIIITSISSTYAHHRHRAVVWPLVSKFTPGLIIGAWIGGMVAARLPGDILKPVFGIFELLVAGYMLSRYKPATHTHQISTLRSSIGGSIIGTISAMVGIGGGTLSVPFLLWHGIAIRKAIATSAALGLPIAIAGTVAYIISGWQLKFVAQDATALTFGYVHIVAFLSIITSSALFAPLGAKLAHRLPEIILKRAFALLLLLIAIKLILS